MVTEEGDTKTSHAIADVLRALDIPTGLTYEQIGAITTLANLQIVMIRTLIDKGILDGNFLEDGQFDLDLINQAIEDMGGSYTDPDLNVT